MRIIKPHEIGHMLNLKPRRKALKLTLRQVEAKTNVSYVVLSMIENNKIARPGFHAIVALHNFYRYLEK